MQGFLSLSGAILAILHSSVLQRSVSDTASIQEAVLSPNQTLFLSIGEGGPALWDSRTGHMLYQIGDIQERSVEACFSLDGGRIVTSAFHWGVAVWNVQTGKIICRINTPAEHVRGVGFSPDGTRIVTVTDSEVIDNWSATTGKQTGRHHRMAADFATIRFSPDFSLVACDDASNPLEIRVAKTGALVRKLRTSASYQCFLAFAHDGKSVLTTSGEDVSRWEIKTGLLLSKFTRPGCLAQSASLSSDGKRMAVGYTDGKTIMWDMATSKRLFQVGRDSTRVNDVYFVAHGTQILTVTKGAATTLWNAKTGVLIRMITQ